VPADEFVGAFFVALFVFTLTRTVHGCSGGPRRRVRSGATTDEEFELVPRRTVIDHRLATEAETDDDEPDGTTHYPGPVYKDLDK
jgi:hypothetical protein